MILSDLVVSKILVNEVTGEPMGYMLMNNLGQVVSLTESKIKELDSDLGSYIEYVNEEHLAVVGYKNKYALYENMLYYDDNWVDEPYRKMGDKIMMWGYVFNHYHVVELDNEAAINNVLTLSEGYND